MARERTEEKLFAWILFGSATIPEMLELHRAGIEINFWRYWANRQIK